MSEKMTVIDLPGSSWPGYMDYGEVDPQKMVETVKNNAYAEIMELRKVLDAHPHDFRVEVVRGKLVQHHIKTLQPGKSD